MPNETDPVPTPQPSPSPALRPGWKTTEFWLSLAATLISGLLSTGVIPTTDTWERITAIVVTVFAAFGYTIVRSGVKKAASMLILIFISATTLSACCYNKSSNDYSTPKCIVARGTVDCTIGSLKDQASKGVEIVLKLISDGTFDVPTLIEALKSAGIKEGECILALVANEFMNKPAAGPVQTNESKFLYSWSDWRVQNRPGVKYTLPKSGN